MAFIFVLKRANQRMKVRRDTLGSEPGSSHQQKNSLSGISLHTFLNAD